MQDVPDEILKRFMERLERSQVPARHHAEYVQWLRYYLDFSTIYPLPNSKADRVRLFCEKLKSKDRNAVLGHASLKTTMIYTHCVPVRTVKEPKSPLDF